MIQDSTPPRELTLYLTLRDSIALHAQSATGAEVARRCHLPNAKMDGTELRQQQPQRQRDARAAQKVTLAQLEAPLLSLVVQAHMPQLLKDLAESALKAITAQDCPLQCFNVQQVTSPWKQVLHIAMHALPVGNVVETVYYKKNAKRESIRIRWDKLPAKLAQAPIGAHQDPSPVVTAIQDTGWTQVPLKLTATHHALNAQEDTSVLLVKVSQTLALREPSPTQAQLNVTRAQSAITAQRRLTSLSLAPIQTSAQVA